MTYLAGTVFDVAYPFVREDVQLFGEDGHYTTKSWRPGVRFEPVYPDDSEAVADGMGAQIVTVVSTHKPGPTWPERVFYTREWRNPTGGRFGKKGLRVKTTAAFRRLIQGYRHHFEMASRDTPASQDQASAQPAKPHTQEPSP